MRAFAPLFASADGEAVRTSAVARMIQEAAQAAGESPQDFAASSQSKSV